MLQGAEIFPVTEQAGRPEFQMGRFPLSASENNKHCWSTLSTKNRAITTLSLGVDTPA